MPKAYEGQQQHARIQKKRGKNKEFLKVCHLSMTTLISFSSLAILGEENGTLKQCLSLFSASGSHKLSPPICNNVLSSLSTFSFLHTPPSVHPSSCQKILPKLIPNDIISPPKNPSKAPYGFSKSSEGLQSP